MILLIDNFDSFTYNLVDYFNQLGQVVDVVRNNIHPNKLDWSKYHGIVLSPGPQSPEKANYLLEYVSFAKNRLPILGICLGHQALNLSFGGTLKKGKRPMHGIVSVVKQLQADHIFNGIKQRFNVVRYHSLVIDVLSNDLVSLSQSEDDEIMIFKHRNLPIYGIQFHPESILTDFGLKILYNWLKVSEISV